MPKQTFQTRTERRQLVDELRELEKNQGKEIAGTKLYKDYIQALSRLDQKMEKLYELGIDGLPATVTKDDKTELLSLLVDVGKCGEQFLSNAQKEKQDLNAGIPRIVGRLQGMLAKDHQVLSRYDPRRSTILPVLQELSRTKTVNLKDHNIKTLGNAQSSRIPMTLRGPTGEKRTGVFTKASHVRVKAPFLELLNEAKGKCNEDGAEELNQLLTKARNYHVRMRSKKNDDNFLSDKTSDDFMCGFVLRELKYLQNIKKSDDLKPAHVKEYLNKIGVDVKKIPGDAIKTLTKGFEAMIKQPGNIINSVGLELKDGQRLDNRNSAMTAVADLLGVGGLLARSDSMRFVDESGEVTEGTFMDYGKGLDLAEHADKACHLNITPLANKNTRNQALKSIADMQILDVLCLNVDRHYGNVLYRVDEKGNLIGLQGIDNDSSFGPRDVSLDEIKDLRVVSEGMAKKIRELAKNPELLKFALRGRGLNEEEINAAAERLNTIDGYIGMRVLRTVPDDRFHELKEEDYLPNAKGHSDNLFGQALRQVQDSVDYRRRMMLPFTPITSEAAPQLTDVSETGRKHTVGGLEDLQNKVSRLLLNKETGFKVGDLTGVRGSSPEFKEMVEAAQTVEHAGLFLQQKYDPETKNRSSLMLDDPKAQKTVKVYNNVFMDLREKTTDYLAKKMEERGAETLNDLQGKNPYEQKRIDYAKKLLAVTDEYLELRDKPLDAEEQIERRRLLEQRSLLGRIDYDKRFKGKEEPVVSEEKVRNKILAEAEAGEKQNGVQLLN